MVAPSQISSGFSCRDQAFVPAPAVSHAKKAQGIQELTKNFRCVFTPKGNAKKAGCSVEISFPKLVFRVCGQGRIKHVLYQRMGLQIFRNFQTAGRRTLSGCSLHSALALGGALARALRLDCG